MKAAIASRATLPKGRKSRQPFPLSQPVEIRREASQRISRWNERVADTSRKGDSALGSNDGLPSYRYKKAAMASRVMRFQGR